MYSAVLLCGDHQCFCYSALEYTQICHLELRKLCFPSYSTGYKDSCPVVINTKPFKYDWEMLSNFSAATENVV